MTKSQKVGAGRALQVGFKQIKSVSFMDFILSSPTRDIAPGPHHGPLCGPLDPMPRLARAELDSLATFHNYFFFLNKQLTSLNQVNSQMGVLFT